MAKTETVRRATGKDQEQWYRLLDKWGAPGRPYREISDWLTGKYGISRWWAQKLIVEYEQDRGIRKPGVRPSGKFEVTATKTVSVPVGELYEAFTDARRRKKWLNGQTMALKSAQPRRSARFVMRDGTTVTVGFTAKGKAKSTVAVTHARLPNAGEAQKNKEEWRAALVELKSVLEA